MAMGHLYGGLASLFTRARCVWFQHGIASLTLLDFLATLLPSEVIYVNSTFSKRAQERLCNRARRVQLLYYGIDLQRFHEKDGTHRGFSIRQKLGIHLEAPVIGNVGRFQQWKGQHVLLQAVPRVLREFPEARFLVVGDTIFGLEPEYKQTLLAMVHDLGITDAVIFPGYRNDVPELLHAVDVFVHSPILPEPFGLVIVEAMARGMPVIASNAGGIPDIVDHEVTGLLIPPGNHEELAEAIVRLLRDPALRKRLGEAGRQKAFERFSAERMTRELEQSYLEIFDAAPQRVTAGRVR